MRPGSDKAGARRSVSRQLDGNGEFHKLSDSSIPCTVCTCSTFHPEGTTRTGILAHPFRHAPMVHASLLMPSHRRERQLNQSVGSCVRFGNVPRRQPAFRKSPRTCASGITRSNPRSGSVCARSAACTASQMFQHPLPGETLLQTRMEFVTQWRVHRMRYRR